VLALAGYASKGVSRGKDGIGTCRRACRPYKAVELVVPVGVNEEA